MSLIKNKSAFAYTEILLMVGSIIMIIVILFLASSAVKTNNKEFEDLSPELSYEFPAIYVNTFLKTPLKNEDRAKFNNQGVYSVKDLIYLNTDHSKELIETYKTEFNLKYSNIDNLHKNYKKFSNDNYDETSLIVILYDLTINELPDLDYLIENKDYAFYMLTSSEIYTVIYFKHATIQNILNSDFNGVP